MSSTSVNQEDYLERIQELIEAKGYARVSDIAAELSINRSSVTNMVQQLSKQGYVNYEKYRGLTLTDEGLKVATEIRDRHETLLELFLLLGLKQDEALEDIEGLEHHVSKRTYQTLKRLIKHLHEFPMS